MDGILKLAGVSSFDQFQTAVCEIIVDLIDADDREALQLYLVDQAGSGDFYDCLYPQSRNFLDRPTIEALRNNAVKSTLLSKAIHEFYVEEDSSSLKTNYDSKWPAVTSANGSKAKTFIIEIYDTLESSNEHAELGNGDRNGNCKDDAFQAPLIIALSPTQLIKLSASLASETSLIPMMTAVVRRLRRESKSRAARQSLTRQKTCPTKPQFDVEWKSRSRSASDRRHSEPSDPFSYYRFLIGKLNDCDCSNKTSEKALDKKLLDLCAGLYNLTHGELQLKILHYLFEATGAETGCILLRSQDVNELSCTCIRDRLLDAELRFPITEENYFGRLIARQEPMIVESMSSLSPAHRQDLQFFLAEELRSLLSVPIVNKTDSKNVVAIVCLANKSEFTPHDVCFVERCFGYTMPVISSAIAFQSERRLRKQTQSLLKVAKNIFNCVDNLNQLLREIMFEASNLTGAERCSVFVYDNDTNQLVAKVFDGATDSNTEQTGGKKVYQPPEVRLSSTTGIAGHVFSNGEILNIKDAYSHPKFYRGVDESTGYKTRNILCFPLQDESGKIVAVAELCNKLNGPYFTEADAEIAKAFGVFCCISLSQSLMYKRVHEEHYRAKLANELMTYHMHTHEDSAATLAQLEQRSVTTFLPDFTEFHSIPRHLSEKDSLHAVVSMFDDLGFTSYCRINRKTLSHFVNAVRLGYRDPPYHNWMHAFSAAHFSYLCLKNFHLDKHLSQLEKFSLLVACLCHDIDHRGTNNSFQLVSKSTLAYLYSSAGSVLERHHVAQTLCLLNADGCKILENLTDDEYKTTIDLVREIILATDLANHLRKYDEIKKLPNLMRRGSEEKLDGENRVLLLSLLMTAADLSDQTKKWANSKLASSLLYREFFSQGDLEKQLGHSPSLMMDRARACVPELQVSFLDGIAIPVYETLSVIFPEASCVAAQCRRNRENWNSLLDRVKSGTLKDSVDIFTERLVEDDNDNDDNDHNAVKKTLSA